MDMEGVFLARIQSFDIGNDLHRIAFLAEAHNTMTLLPRGWVQHGDGFGWSFGRVQPHRKRKRTYENGCN